MVVRAGGPVPLGLDERVRAIVAAVGLGEGSKSGGGGRDAFVSC